MRGTRLTGLTLLVLLGTASTASAQAAADSTPLLTADQVTRYIAVKKALRSYWQAPAHAALLQTAQATEHYPPIDAVSSEWSLVARVYNYPALVKRDSALAAIFAKNNFAPEQYEPVQVAVHQAMLELVAGEVKSPDYGPSARVLKNIAVIRPQRHELEAVGVVPYTKQPTFLRNGVTMGLIDTPNGQLYLKMMEP